MTTDTAQVAPPTRRQPQQLVNTLKKTVVFGDQNTSAAFDNSLPEGAFILGVKVEIVAAFDGTPTLTIGTNSTTYNDIVAAGDVDELTIGVTEVGRAWGGALNVTAGKAVYAKLAATSATVGKAVIVISYEGGWSS